jgi:hypothetical protein
MKTVIIYPYYNGLALQRRRVYCQSDEWATLSNLKNYILFRLLALLVVFKLVMII